MLLATPVCPPLLPGTLPALPLLPSLLSEEPTLVLAVTLPTLLESFMLPRGRLRLIPMFWDMAATQATDMPASATPGTGTPATVATALTRPLLVWTLLDTPLLLFQPCLGPMQAPADTVQTPLAQSTVPKAKSSVPEVQSTVPASQPFHPLHLGQNPLYQGRSILLLELDNFSVTNASK